MILFTDRIEQFIPPAKGVSHALRIIRDVLGFKASGAQTNIPAALDYLGRVVRKRCVVFLVSDFLGEGYERSMRVLSRKHDLIAVTVSDPRELALPDLGLLELEDAETGELVLLDSGSRRVRDCFADLGQQRMQKLRLGFRSMDVDQIDLLTGEDYAKKLVGFFRHREKMH